MAILSNILQNVFTGNTDFCTLCFIAIEETETQFNIRDEILMDTGNAVVLYEIISTVFGDQVLNSIPTHKIFCKNCLKTLITCYKFIQQCKNNIQELYCKLNTLQKNIETVNDVNCDYKSVFIALNNNNSKSELYYDKHRHGNDQTMLLKRFQTIKKDSLHFFIEIEEEPPCEKVVKDDLVKKRKQSIGLQKQSDIAVDTSDLDNLKCKTCLKLYPSIQKLKMHYQSVHGPKDYKCSDCPKQFTLLSRLNQHKKICHHSAMCSQCGKTYNNYFSLKYHEESHKKLKLICQTCGKGYKGKQVFDKHVKYKMCNEKRKSNSESKFICDYCEKKYASKCTLSKHISVEHENGSSFLCSWCGKKFGCKSGLSSHIVKHTKQKDFICDLCGGKFVSKTSLLYHMRRHTGDKPYKCEYCDKTFVALYRRNQHVQSRHSMAHT